MLRQQPQQQQLAAGAGADALARFAALHGAAGNQDVWDCWPVRVVFADGSDV